MKKRHLQIVSFLVLFLESWELDAGRTCKTQLPPFGPRLLRAKALFGETIRACKKEFVAYAKEIPPEKLRHVLVMVCTQYHKCRSLITTEEFRTSHECLIQTVRNESSSHYMHLNFTKEYVNAANNTLTCVLNHISNSTLNVQAVDDATAFALKAVVNFGWTK
ncbi:uncharacterized protein LOC142769231 isoform X1 [Rhipicephalus microplus]|uniref:uncharacterized protein LOC142769231 isoform X1 n=1 Tax=Rhipicephalus microplus TaxID=6941 RepID=UPI003F6D31FE